MPILLEPKLPLPLPALPGVVPPPPPPPQLFVFPALTLPLLLLVLLVVLEQSFCGPILRKVGVPSMVLTMGLSKPPRSNSWADIFLKKRRGKIGIKNLLF